jgi:hypothetical protein
VLHGAGAARPGAPDHLSRKHLVADFDAVSIAVDAGHPPDAAGVRAALWWRTRTACSGIVCRAVWGYIETARGRSTSDASGPLGPAGQQIETVIGLGYRFNE